MSRGAEYAAHEYSLSGSPSGCTAGAATAHRRYGQCDIAAASYMVAIGGDGTALRALQAALPTPGKPVFAMRLPGSVGALGNAFDLANLDERLQAARRISVRPLRAEATLVAGGTVTAFGINEIVVSRQALQAAKLCVKTEECPDIERSWATGCWSPHRRKHWLQSFSWRSDPAARLPTGRPDGNSRTSSVRVV